jgi:polyhydroxyalkanoate synthesis regulator phasin
MKELVTNVTSAASTEPIKKVRYLRFEYADNLALEIKELVKELVKKGVKINMSENKEEL